MLLKNINEANDFCKVTKLQVIELGKCVIFVIVTIGKNLGGKIFIQE